MLLRLPGAIEMTVAHVVENDDRLNQTKKHYRKSLHIEIVTQKTLALPLLSGCQQPGSDSCGCSDKPFPPAVRLPVTNIIGQIQNISVVAIVNKFLSVLRVPPWGCPVRA